MTTLQGKVAWITGASSGIGRACAHELAARGATVAVSARRRDRLVELVGDIERNGGRALAVDVDVCDESQLLDASRRVADELGGIDIALANAGSSVPGTIAELTAEAWRRQLELNVVAAAMTARFALPHLRARKGRLGITGSVASFMPAPGYGAYHASKYAVRALGATLSLELAGSGVSCTTLHPGFVASEIMQVDERGRHDALRGDPRPALLIWSAERAARTMIDAVMARRREVVFTGHGRIGAWLAMHFPGLVHNVMALGPMVSMAGRFQGKEHERSKR